MKFFITNKFSSISPGWLGVDRISQIVRNLRESQDSWPARIFTVLENLEDYYTAAVLRSKIVYNLILRFRLKRGVWTPLGWSHSRVFYSPWPTVPAIPDLLGAMKLDKPSLLVGVCRMLQTASCCC